MSVVWKRAVGSRKGSGMVVVERERRLWEDLFVNTIQWWDNRAAKRSARHPDFRHKIIKEPVWLSSPCKPAWVDSRLPALHLHDAPSSMCLQLQSLCDHGDLDKAMDILLHMPDCALSSHNPYWSFAKACNQRRSLSHTKQVFYQITGLGLEAFSLVAEFLVGTLAKCGDIEAAIGAFHMLPFRSTFSWTAMIFLYLDSGEPTAALQTYQRMQDESVNPNERTFVAVLRACGSTLDLEKGRAIHKQAQEAGLAVNAFVGCTLVSMYGKCGSIKEALGAFEGMPRHSVVSWTAMLSALVQQGEEVTALQLYKLMQEEGVGPNDRTVVVVLQACGELAEREDSIAEESRSVKVESLEIGQALHSFARRRGYHSDVFICSTLVSMYGKCGRIEQAENAYYELDHHNIVLWNAMLSAYVDCGFEKKAMQLYIYLQGQDYILNKRTYAIVIQACCMLAEQEEALLVNTQPIKCMALDIVNAIHAVAQRKEFDSDAFVGSVLVCAYGKCGNLIEAEKVFSKLQVCDTILWTGLLFVYTEQGETRKALQIYMQMREKGATLDDVTLTCALQACTDTESLTICEQIHFAILSTRYGLTEALAINLIHTYGGCRHVASAQAVFDGLDCQNVVLWTALMDGYKREGKYGESLQIFEEMKLGNIHPDGISFLLALSACGHSGLVDKGVEYFESMYRVYKVIPETKHYVSVVDLLGRGGYFSKLEGLLLRIAAEPNMEVWLSLLDACRTYGNVEVAKWAFDHAMQINSGEAAVYSLMSNVYANAGLRDSVSHSKNLRHGKVDTSR